MKLPSKSEYPAEVLIPTKTGEVEEYKVVWVRKLPGKNTLAECDPGDREIRIKLGQSREELAQCLIHEILHALEFEYPIPLSHKTIYKLEKAIFMLLKLNIYDRVEKNEKQKRNKRTIGRQIQTFLAMVREKLS